MGDLLVRVGFLPFAECQKQQTRPYQNCQGRDEWSHFLRTSQNDLSVNI